MKYFTICLSIFALLNIPLSQAYGQIQKREELKIDLNFFSPLAKGMNLVKALSIIDSAKAADVDTDAEKKKGEEEAKTKLKTEGYDVSEYTDDDKSIAVTFIIVIIMMITAPIFIAGCPKPDTALHLIGAIMMVVLEGVFWGMYEQGSKKALEIMEEEKGNYDAQLNSFKAAMEITTKAKTWMTAKFGAQVAIAIIIGLAMAVVLIMSIIQSVRSLGVEAPIAQSCKAVGSVPDKRNQIEIYTEARKNFNFPLPIDESIKRLKNVDDIGQLAFINEEIEQFNAGAIKSQPIDDYQIITKDKDFNTIVEQTKGFASDFGSIAESFLIQNAQKGSSKFAALVKELIIQDAVAVASPSDSSTETGDKGWSDKEMGSKLAGMGIGAAVGVIVPIALAVTGAMKALKEINGWTRAAIYAVEVAFISALAAFSKKSADQLGQRADEYQRLYEQLTTIMANAPGRGANTPVPLPPQQIYKNAGNAAVAEMDGKCFTGSSAGEATPDPSCGCKASKSCKKTNMPKMTFPDFKTPSVLASSAKLAGDMGDQIYSGDMRGGMLSAQGLGRNAVAVKKMNSSLMALANQKLAEFGKPTQDFSKMTNDYKNQAMKQMSQGFAGLSQADQNAAIGAILGKEGGKSEKEVEVASVGPSGGKGGAGSGASGAKKKGIFDFVGDKDEKTKLQGGAEKEKEGKGLDEYEDSTKQITEGGEKNLFKIIEIRYMRSAYPVFFETKDK